MRVHVIAVQNEEADIAFLVGVVFLSVHVEELVEPLVGSIVVSQSRVEVYARIEQDLIGLFELGDDIETALVVVEPRLDIHHVSYQHPPAPAAAEDSYLK